MRASATSQKRKPHKMSPPSQWSPQAWNGNAPRCDRRAEQALQQFLSGLHVAGLGLGQKGVDHSRHVLRRHRPQKRRPKAGDAAGVRVARPALVAGREATGGGPSDCSIC